MYHLKKFIELTRLNKPIGIMLLFWPCSWGLTYAYNLDQNLNIFLYYLLLFFLGSVLMRSAGCIFNDIVDRDFDKKVQRTKQRPIASGEVSVNQSIVYVLILCLISFFILIQFNFKTIYLGLGSMVLAFSYPYMKRITYWPQLFLGLTFNWGMVMAYTSILDQISIEIILLYLSAIFWTLGYDTIYGTQDMSDDEIIGLKSTSIKFKNNIKFFISGSYLISALIILYLFKNNIGLNIFSIFLSLFIFSLVYQICKFNKNYPKTCLEIFRFNNYTGIFLFLSIFSIKL